MTEFFRTRSSKLALRPVLRSSQTGLPSVTKHREPVCRCQGCGAKVKLATMDAVDGIGLRCFHCRSMLSPRL